MISNMFDSVLNYRRWKYIPPPYICPFTLEHQFAYVFINLFML